MRTNPILVEQLFNAPVSSVWTAITQHKGMIQWYFENIKAFEPKVGFKTQFNVQSGGRDFFHIWEITEVELDKKISYRWKYKAFPGESFSEFELFPNGNGTKLILTITGLESFPQDIPEFSRESCMAGWDYFIKGRLKEFLKN